MSISAKELAKELNLSEAAVSLALNNKPGVSTQTRQRVWNLAREKGYDFSKAHTRESRFKGVFCLIQYNKTGAVLSNSSYFDSMINGAVAGSKRHSYDIDTRTIWEDDELDKQLYMLKKSAYSGLIIIASEMDEAALQGFSDFKCPIILLDTCLTKPPFNSIAVNNRQGTAQAVSHLLISTRHHPGYLHSSYVTSNYASQSEGFFGAIKRHGLSTASSVVHLLSPSRAGAYADMCELISCGEELAKCYFADSDEIALGAIQAFVEAGYRVPEDIAVVGYGDIPASETSIPALSTIRIPTQYMGELAAARLVQIIEDKLTEPVRVEVCTELRKRKSV